MKKTTLSLLSLLLLCLLALSACSGGEDAGVYETGDVQAMADAGAFSEPLETLDGDTAFALYRLSSAGLTREDLTDCAVLRSSGATCEEGAVLVFAGEEQAEAALSALKDYIQGQITSNQDYRPEEIPKLEAALVDRRGNTVLLAVASDQEAVQSALE